MTNVTADYSAQRGNPIYGNSDTVTPPSTTLYPWVVAYTEAIPASTAQAAEFQQGLSGKADANLGNVASNLDYVVESYKNGANWYRKYKSGWIEQGGTIETANKTITFLKPFSDTNYTLVGPGFYIANAGAQIITKTTTGFTTSSDTNLTGTRYWEAKGQGAN